MKEGLRKGCRKCLAAEVGQTFTAREVILTLQYLFVVRGTPEHIRSDNGPEFIAQELQRWLEQALVRHTPRGLPLQE